MSLTSFKGGPPGPQNGGCCFQHPNSKTEEDGLRHPQLLCPQRGLSLQGHQGKSPSLHFTLKQHYLPLHRGETRTERSQAVETQPGGLTAFRPQPPQSLVSTRVSGSPSSGRPLRFRSQQTGLETSRLAPNLGQPEIEFIRNIVKSVFKTSVSPYASLPTKGPLQSSPKEMFKSQKLCQLLCFSFGPENPGHATEPSLPVTEAPQVLACGQVRRVWSVLRASEVELSPPDPCLLSSPGERPRSASKEGPRKEAGGPEKAKW